MEEVVLPKQAEMQKLRLVQLINLLSSLPSNTNSEYLTKTIYDKFKNRFYGTLFKLSSKLLANVVDWTSVVDEIFQDTCLLFFHLIRSKQFKLDGTISDEKALSKICKWLRLTSSYKIMEYLRAHKRNVTNFEKYKLHIEMGFDDGESVHRNVERSYDLHRLKQVLSKMKPVERDIIILSHEYECFPTIDNKNKKHFPKDVRLDVCKKYGINDVYFRKIKQVAFDKIIACRI